MSHALDTTAGAAHRGRLKVALILTTGYLMAEVVGGLLAGSLALLADAGHMLTDVGGLALALFAIAMGQRSATAERTFGYYRVEILAAVANATVLLGISGYILWAAYGRFRAPGPVAGGTVLVVATVGLIVNLIGMRLLAGGSGESLNVKGAYLELLSDMVSSIGVIVAGIVIFAGGPTWIDPLVSAGIGLYIVPRTWVLLREAVGVLLEGTPADVNLAAVREALAAVPGVDDVHDLHAWVLTSGVNALSAHIQRQVDADSQQVLTLAHAAVITGFPIRHVTLQIEVGGCPDGSLVHD